MNTMVKNCDVMAFWDPRNMIITNLLYEFLSESGFGLYFPGDRIKNKTGPIIVKVTGNIASQVNAETLLGFARDYILETNSQSGTVGQLLDSLDQDTDLFGDKNLRLLRDLSLKILSDTEDTSYFFFKNGVVQVSREDIVHRPYSDFDKYILEERIIQMDFTPIKPGESLDQSAFLQFLIGLTVNRNSAKSEKRLISLMSAVGYFLHRSKSIASSGDDLTIALFMYDRLLGKSGKSLLAFNCKQLHRSNLPFDKFNFKEVLIFDDVERNLDFEKILPLIKFGVYKRSKHEETISITFGGAPEVIFMSEFPINVDANSKQKRKSEFMVHPAYIKDYNPGDQFTHVIYNEWDQKQLTLYYNTIFRCLQVYLNNGLVGAESVNIKLELMISRTSKEFVKWAEYALPLKIRHDKKKLYDQFLKAYPRYNTFMLSQRDFTIWLRLWGEYMNLNVSETHSRSVRYITFSEK